MADQPSSAPPTTFAQRFRAFARTLDGKAQLIALAICLVTAILAVLFVLPDVNEMGALGIFSIYVVVLLMITGICRMVLRLFERKKPA